MSYGNVYRFLLRSIASRGVMTVAETELLLASITEGDNAQVSVQNMVTKINEKISPFQQNIKIANDELTNEEVLIFLSLGYDDATKAQNLFSASELEFFRLLLEQIMTTEARQVTGIHAVNIVSQMKGSFTKTDAQKLLHRWCEMRYLDQDGENYALGVRAIHEFEGYLRQNMPDTIEECCLCKQIVFRGFNCPTCAKAVHTRCLNRYLEKIDKWPCCKETFSQEQLDQLQNEITANETRHSESAQSSHQQTTETSNKTSSPQNSRLSHSQMVLPSPTPDEAINEPTVVLEETEEMESTQEIIPEVSQRVTKKRKRLP